MDGNKNPANSNLPINVTRLYLDNSGHKCGYCNKPDSSFSFGTVLDPYPVEIYERMMKDGWRRCGDYVYIPNLDKSCCKLYTHCLNVEEFKINKDQKKVMKRFRKYLSGEYEQNLEKNKINEDKKPAITETDIVYQKIDKILMDYIKQEKYLEIINKHINIIDKNLIIEKAKQSHVRKNTNNKFKFDYSIDFIFVIRKIIESLVEKNKIQFNSYDNLQQDLFNHFKQFYNSENEILELFPKTGHINIINKAKEKKDEKKEEIKQEIEKDKIKEIKKEKKEKKEKPKKPIKEKYTFDYFQEFVNEPEIYLPLKHKYTFEVTDKIKINNEKFQVYKKYQMNVHKDPESKVDYSRFDDSWGKSTLKDNIGIKLPADLATKTKHPEIYPKNYGCYNFIHRIDGKIVAVGIVDILPTFLSSVYLYYDTDYQFLDLGVFTAIIEIEYAKSFHALIDKNFKYYTMGFYSENVQKLRYKGFYYPTQILDRFTMNFVYLHDVQNILKEGKHVQLSKEQKNPKYEYLTKNEIDKYVDNLMINYHLHNNKIINLDFNGFVYNYIRENYWERLFNSIKRFIGLIPKDLLKQISFYADFN